MLNSNRKAKFVCALSGKERVRHDLVPLDQILPSISDRIRSDHPSLASEALIAWNEVARYRKLYVEELLRTEHGELTELDRQVAATLATHNMLAEDVDLEFKEQRTFAERLSDHLASFGGSWTFIIWFLISIVLWIVLNAAADNERFDPYPYILLNLILSCVAALQAPIIMMSQKRQEAKDRLRSQNDYRVNLKAELEVRQLHEKIDHLMSRQWKRSAEIQEVQLEAMHDMVVRQRQRET